MTGTSRAGRSAERIRFEQGLRTGIMPASDGIERKFNPNHDPDNGRFAFGSGGTGGVLPLGPIHPVTPKQQRDDDGRLIQGIATTPLVTAALQVDRRGSGLGR